ncbi:MAG: response regulator [Deltaproteobacteria bacterium]|nr:response regulator [Candidatus Tharpella sp.]
MAERRGEKLMENRTYIQFVLMALVALMLFSVGGYIFYNRVSHHLSYEVQREQEMVADRITENLQSYLNRVRQTVDSTLDFIPYQVSDIKKLTAHRFKLLWKIYPEISHLAFLASDGEVYYTGEDGDFMPLGLPLQEVYEWQYFDYGLWNEIDDEKLHQRISVLMHYVPELGKVMPVPIIIFAKRVVVDGEYVGLVLVPYNFDFMFTTYCRSMVIEKRREIVVADSLGRVVFSSLPGLLLRDFYPAYGSSSDLLLEKSEQVLSLDKKELSLVVAALANRNSFSTTMKISSGGQNNTLLAAFQTMEMVTADWTVMVATPRTKADELAWRLLIPVILLCILMLLIIALFSFFMFRRLGRFAQENAIFKAGLASSADGVVVLDGQGRYLFVNRAYCEITGESAPELLGSFFQVEGEGVDGLPKNIFALVAEQGRWQDVVSYQKIGKKPVEVSQNFSEIHRVARKVGYISNLHDISEERRLNREVKVYSEFLHKEVDRQTKVILQSQKMETVGILAAGFAHDFNNLLASMHGNIELLEMMLEKAPQKAGRYIKRIRQISIQAAELTRQILLFSRRDIGVTEAVAVADLVESVLVLVPPSLPAQISFDCLEDSCDLKLEVDRAAIVQTILNLVLNAGEAFAEDQENAQIKIISKAKFVDRYLAERLNLAPGNWYCEITVSDNGSGIPSAMMGKIFDPFFSTKEWSNKKGTGLSLAIAYRTIANHSGVITVNSELGVGSSFIVYLPAAINPGKSLPSVPEREYSHDLNARKILVVEDEEPLRESLKVLLELHGARVESVANGKEALERLEAVSVDLIVLDLVMPEMGGEEFLSEMQIREIKIPVLVMTGTLNEGFRVSRLFPVVLEVVEKPFSQKQLLHLCSQMLS